MPFRIGSGEEGRTFGGLVDELEVTKRAIGEDELYGIFTADAYGKCQDGVSVPNVITCCPDYMNPQAGNPAYFKVNVCNYSQETRTYRQRIVTRSDPGCDLDLTEDDFFYSTADIVLGPGACANQNNVLRCPATTGNGCYDVFLDRVVNGATSYVAKASGKVKRLGQSCFDHSTVLGELEPKPIYTTSPKIITFVVKNENLPSFGQNFIPYSVVAHSSDGDEENSPIGLNYQTPGLPAVGWLQVAPGADAILSISVGFAEHQPLDTHSVDLMIDIDGNGRAEIVASVPVRSLLGAEPGPVQPPPGLPARRPSKKMIISE